MRVPELGHLIERLHVVSLPLVTRFRGVEHREIALLDGPAAWAEWSPFLEYDARESASWLRAAIEWGWDETIDRHESAVVRVNATVPAVSADEVPAVLARFDGCRTAKVKVAERGQSLTDDMARVAAVRTAMGPEARLRVDANAGWSVEEAVAALTSLAPFGLEYAEQPVPTVEGLAEVRRRLCDAGVTVPIAADESVRKAEDPLAVARAGAADVIIVKTQPLGGIRSALAVVEAAGLPATVSSALDSSVGLGAGAALAAAVAPLTERFGGPAGGFDAGLGTASLLAADVCASPLRAVDGGITAGSVRVDPERLRTLTVAPDRLDWWRSRLRSSYGALVAPLS